MAKYRVSSSAAAAVLCLLLGSEAQALDYPEARLEAVKRCEAIDPSESQSGMLFNPDGYRSYYVRSRCFQNAAVQFRDAAMCASVRERWSLFWSSWGYSAARCRQLVAEGIAKDRTELEAMKRAYVAGGIKLRAFRVQRNGNGRDVDIIPSFEGTFAHGYTLTFEIVRTNAAPVLLHSLGYYVDANSNLSIYVPQVEIRQRFPAFELNRPYLVRATIALSVGNGGQSGYWSDAFIESVFPVGERLHSMTRESVF